MTVLVLLAIIAMVCLAAGLAVGFIILPFLVLARWFEDRRPK